MSLKTHYDAELVAESVKGLADELRSIIMDNPSWHAKAVGHVMFDKLDHIKCLHSFRGIASAHLEK